MDCNFLLPEGRFNFRVGAVIVHNGRLLGVHDQGRDTSGFHYLPGGRVRLHETMEQALCRELWEELGVRARITRPLWLCESFFSLEGEPIHELCLYFLGELDWPRLPSLTGPFLLADSDGQEHAFAWLTEEQVRTEPLFPLVLGENWPRLPESLTLVTDQRDRAAGPR